MRKGPSKCSENSLFRLQMWLYLAQALLQELWLDTARAASTAQTLQCSVLQVWGCGQCCGPGVHRATGEAGCCSETPQIAKRCDLFSASDSKLCSAFSIVPKSDPLLPFLAFCIVKICFWVRSTRKQPALLLQLGSLFPVAPET